MLSSCHLLTAECGDHILYVELFIILIRNICCREPKIIPILGYLGSNMIFVVKTAWYKASSKIYESSNVSRFKIYYPFDYKVKYRYLKTEQFMNHIEEFAF